VRANGPVYHFASMVMAAIDAMATLLARNPEYGAIKRKSSLRSVRQPFLGVLKSLYRSSGYIERVQEVHGP
jgi:hypothetical protein